MTLRTMKTKEMLARAIGKEDEAHLFYKFYAGWAEDPGSKVLLEELSGEELKHKEILENFDEKKAKDFKSEKIQDIRINDFLTRRPVNKSSKIQDVLICAIKKEEDARKFYSSWVSYVEDETVSRVLEILAQEELKHKVKLERMYEELFLSED